MTMLSIALPRIPPAKGLEFGIGLVCLLVSTGTAHAQSCVEHGDTATTCRFLLTRPLQFAIKARAKFVSTPPQSAPMTITVNGHPCRGPEHQSRSVTWGECRIEIPATTAVVEAKLDAPGVHTKGVKVTLISNSRLATLPAEAADLYPKDHPDHFWSVFWPFPR
jgi:hypothetical protein